MKRLLSLAAVAALAMYAPASSNGLSEITGQYVEARTCDIWTGPCFANADFNLTGKNAVVAWQVKQGTFNGVRLDGLGVVAVISADQTLGLPQGSTARTLVIVDQRADAAQREALVALVRKQGGDLLQNVVAVRSSAISLTNCECEGGTCAIVEAGGATIRTRCIDSHKDSHCGNETAFYPPLTRGVNARPAACVEHAFNGAGLSETWSDVERRGAYVGSFSIR